MALAPPIGTVGQGSINSPGSVGENSNAVVPNSAPSIGSDPSGIQAAAAGGEGVAGGISPDLLAWLNEVYKNTGATVAGTDTQVIFNDDGILTGDPFLTVDTTATSGQQPTLKLDGTSGFYRWPTLLMNFDANDYASIEFTEEGITKGNVRYYANSGAFTDALIIINTWASTSATNGVTVLAADNRATVICNEDGVELANGAVRLESVAAATHADVTAHGQLYYKSGDGLLYFRDSAGVEYDLTGTVPPSAVLSSGSSPYFGWEETDAGLDQGFWRLFVDGETLYGRVYDDAETNFYSWLQVERSGTGASVTVDSVKFNAAEFIYADAISPSLRIESDDTTVTTGNVLALDYYTNDTTGAGIAASIQGVGVGTDGKLDLVFKTGTIGSPETAMTISTLTQSVTFADAIIAQTYIQCRTETTTNLADITHAVNTDAGKVKGSMVFNSTTNQPVWANGNTDGALWLDATGATAHTPV